MAGKKLRKFLEKLGPDGFYELYHAWLENAIATSNGLGYIDLVVRLIKEHPDFQAGDPVGMELDSYVGLSQQTRLSIRDFFWPMTDTQDTQRPWKEHLELWQPFDEQAWDAIPPKFFAVLQETLPALEKFPQAALACSDGLIFKDFSIADLLNKLPEYFQRLQRLSIPAGIEYELLIHHHLSHLKAECEMFHFSLNRLREDCGENAALSPELESQSQQDEEFYRELSRVFWPGTFHGDPDEEPDKNHWYPYVESAWDAAQAQVTDASRSFVQLTRQRMETMQATPIADPSTEENLQRFFRIADMGLNAILHRVAILEL